MKRHNDIIKKRFRGFLPVVIDVETAGVNANTDALLEIAAVLVHPTNDSNTWHPHEHHHWHLQPFPGTKINQKALEINGIDPTHPFRLAIPEKQALTELFTIVKQHLNKTQCQRAVLVGHNAHFDLNFIRAACARQGISQMPFHDFTCLDTATMAAVSYGETVLAKALKKADIDFDSQQAHSALYDTTVTAKLFCQIINHNPIE
jgi:ribonuclease T